MRRFLVVALLAVTALSVAGVAQAVRDDIGGVGVTSIRVSKP